MGSRISGISGTGAAFAFCERMDSEWVRHFSLPLGVSETLRENQANSLGGDFGDRRVEWPPKLRHGQMWKYGTVLKEGELEDEPSL